MQSGHEDKECFKGDEIITLKGCNSDRVTGAAKKVQITWCEDGRYKEFC